MDYSFDNGRKNDLAFIYKNQRNMEDAMRVLGNECREEGREEGMAILAAL